jgi:hypothetical protein
MCLFHKWEKWSVPQKQHVVRVDFGPMVNPINPPIEYNHIKWYQERTCKKCGLLQKKYIKAYDGEI